MFIFAYILFLTNTNQTGLLTHNQHSFATHQCYCLNMCLPQKKFIAVAAEGTRLVLHGTTGTACFLAFFVSLDLLFAGNALLEI